MRRILPFFLSLILLIAPLSAFAEEATFQALDAFVQSALDRDAELLYKKNDEQGYYLIVFEADDNRLGDIYAYIDIYSSGLLIQACYEDDLPMDNMDEIVKFMNLLNADQLGGKYYIYNETGTVFYEFFLFLDFLPLDSPDEAAQENLLSFLDTVVTELNFDAEYFVELIGGLSADNAYAMYLADLEHFE